MSKPPQNRVVLEKFKYRNADFYRVIITMPFKGWEDHTYTIIPPEALPFAVDVFEKVFDFYVEVKD